MSQIIIFQFILYMIIPVDNVTGSYCNTAKPFSLFALTPKSIEK